MINEYKSTSAIRQDRNKLLNFLKGLGCIFVVFIHVSFPGIFGEIICYIGRLGVPVFFLISGFFAYSPDGSGTEKMTRRARRIARIIVYALLLYMCGTLVLNVMNHSVKEWFVELLNWKTWINMILFSDFEILSAGHLWFLSALIYSYLFFWVVEKKNAYHLIYKTILALFLLRIVVISVALSFDLSWHLWGNFLIGALPWFSLGNYIAYNEKFRTKFSNGTLAGLAFGSLIFGLFFRLCDLPLDLSEIGIMICATSLFLLAINNPSVSIHKEIEKLGDTYSLYVYIIHIFVSGVIGTCAQMFHQENTLWYAWLKPLIVLIVSIIGSIVIHHLVVKIKQILYPAK